MSTIIYPEGSSSSSTRFNLCPNPRYLGEDSLTGEWGGTPLQFDTTTGAPDGGGYTEVTLTGDQTGNAYAGNDLFLSVNAVEGELYTASAYIRAPRAGGVDIRLTFTDASGTALGGGVTIVNDTVAANTWKRLVVPSVVAPAGTEGFRITLTFQNSLGLVAGDVCGIAQRQLELGDFDTTYFDGDYPPTSDGRAYRWQGTAHDSVSIETDYPAAVSPDLVIDYAHERDTGVTVHETVTGTGPVIARRDVSRLPTGTFQFFCATQALAAEVADMCNGQTNVTLRSDGVPGAPFDFCPTERTTTTWNTPFESWTVSVPYVRVT